MKILELHLSPLGQEQYQLSPSSGFSRLEAASHLLKAAAETLDDVQVTFDTVFVQERYN